MSVDIWIAAQKKLTATDLDHIHVFNTCVDLGVDPPDKVKRHLAPIVGEESDAIKYGEPIHLTENDMVEIGVKTDGDVMYHGGAVFQLSDLPDGTVSIRVYASA